MDNITINYREASVISGLKIAECKDIFQKALNQKTVAPDEECDLFRLDIQVPNITSVDLKYDGKGFFTVHAKLAKDKYRKYLSHKEFVKYGNLPGGATVFLKICTPVQIEHINRVLSNYNHKTIAIKTVAG